MNRNIKDWQIKGSFLSQKWVLKVLENESWKTEAESNSTVDLLKKIKEIT
jgi:hypothetical protein|tara:strand:- start:76 stop:225 length:150 start_codon:yes stop_codon:yes gene_type:complete